MKPNKLKLNIFLFHRDLRIQDNTSLIAQMKIYGPVVPIFIFVPEQIDSDRNKYFSNSAVQFMIESLRDLDKNIHSYKKSKLHCFYGQTLDVLKYLHKRYTIGSIGFNIDYTPYATERDTEIAKWAAKNDIDIVAKEDYLIHSMLNGQTLNPNTGRPYLIYSAFAKHCLKNLTVRSPDTFTRFAFAKIKKQSKYSFDIKHADKFYNSSDIGTNIYGTRKAGLQILKHRAKWSKYSKYRDMLTYNTTGLGPYLRFGSISIREAYKAFARNRSLIKELLWRDYFANVTFRFPKVLRRQVSSVANASFKPGYDSWTMTAKKKQKYIKWTQGRTGVPIIDAAMRQMNATGYMPNRTRMLVASYLIKDLGIHWTIGERYFATKLRDYDPMSNNGNWQWIASCGADANPPFRTFNPWLQQQRYDPKFEYIRKWLPEFSD